MSPEEELRARSEVLRSGVGRLLGCEIRTRSAFERSLVGAGMRFGVGDAGVTGPRVWSPCASPLSLELGRSRLGRASTTPSRPLGLAACMDSLAALRLVFLNSQAVWASTDMAAPTKSVFAW